MVSCRENDSAKHSCESSNCRKEAGIRVANVFHAGDGNLHPLIMFDGNEEGALHRAEALAAKLLRLCIEMGGSITGEHGVGMEKRDFLPEMFDEPSVAMMDRIRRAMDPRLIANPGKMFPGKEAPALSSDRTASAGEGRGDQP